jgi:methylenetetrahydrofolate dehydrogenase (NADP+)/methenyltetrahydrofolate cyclohydrolase
MSAVTDTVQLSKDVDGFLPNSPFNVPVALSVGEILQSVDPNFPQSAKDKKIVVIGRGETAGGPIYQYLVKVGLSPEVVHSKTTNPDEIIKNADIVISCVGKKDVITAANTKPGATLVSVGIWRDENGKLHGDYDVSAIASIAQHYTPTPGGVGPVNVACLMQNLIAAATTVTP